MVARRADRKVDQSVVRLAEKSVEYSAASRVLHLVD